MNQLLDKETETRRGTPDFASPASFVSQPATGAPAGVLATQSLLGNAAIAAAGPELSKPQTTDPLQLQSTFGNAAVTRSAEVGLAGAQPFAATPAPPMTAVTTTITDAEKTAGAPTVPAAAVYPATADTAHDKVESAATAVVTTPEAPAPVAGATQLPASGSIEPAKAAAESPAAAPTSAAVTAPATGAPTPAAAKTSDAASKSTAQPGAVKTAKASAEGSAEGGKTPATAAAAKGSEAAAKSAAQPGATKGGKATAEGATDGGKEKAAAPSPREAMAPAIGAVRQRATGARKHSPPAAAVGSAQAAAVNPPTEQTRGAATQTVANLDATKTEAVKRDEFKTKLKEAIAKATPEPKTKSEAERVMKTGAAEASGTLRGQLATERDAAAGPMKSAAATEVEPSAQPAPTETKLQPEQVGAPPAPVSAAPVVPAALPAERLDYSSDREPTDRAMAENEVTTEQLGKGNEPAFGSALEARQGAEEHEAKAAATYRKSEAGIQDQAHKSAEKELGKGLGGIHGARATQIGQVAGQQTATRDKNALERKRITDVINGIKDKTRSEVAGILSTMEDEAGKIFEAGLKRAEKAYEDTFDEAKGGIGTWLTTWGDDWDELIEKSLGTARREYLRQVDLAIDDVANLVDAKLSAAKQKVADGRKQVETFVKGLDDSVKKFGQEALESVSGDFDAMGAEIDQHRDALINKLVDQYKASYERMSAKEEQLREANKSLWKRVYDATIGLIKKIIAFKDMLVSVLAKAAGVIGDIIADPIGFLGNLVDGIGLGIRNFKDRIGEHLKQGLIEWLFGELAAGGIQLPETFDLKGILNLVLQILGLTYANIRARAVTILGEKVVAALETAAEIFKILVTEGPSGLWKYIVEKIGDFKETILEQVKSFIIERVIIAGITWLIGLLNPASAFFKACKAIYDIVMFFIERGSQILALINAIIDSMASIAKGAIDVAAKFVEDALAKAIPVVIGFLASLLGLGGISDKIKEIINAIRQPINSAIDWVITKAVDMVKAVGGLLGFGKKDEPQPGKTDDPEHDLKVEAGLAAIDEQDKLHLNKEGKISREEAEEVAAKIKTDHPIFKTLKVVQGEGTWDFEYTASAGGKKTGAPIETTPGDSAENPIDFEWVKPAVANYPPVQLAPADEVAKATDTLGRDPTQAEVAKLPKAFLARPTQSTTLDDRTVGVTNPGSQTAPGFIFQAETKVSGNTEKDAINRKLKKFGYNRNDNANPPTDGDHVMEKQLGGKDAENNVWPLNSAVNQESGRKMRLQIKDIVEKYKLAKGIVGKYLRLKF